MSASERDFWNSPATRGWSERHEPIDRQFAALTDIALAAAAPQPGESVIDVGCGSGTTLLALAERVGPTGHATGCDIAEASVALARRRIVAARLKQADMLLADAGSHPFPPGAADLIFSRFGVMFFADPVAAFGNLRAALKPGGRVALAVFRRREENPWVLEPFAAIRDLVPPPPQPGPEEPGQFAFGDPARVRRILSGAGFRDILLTPHDPPMRLCEPGGAAKAAEAATNFGPTVRSLAGASPERVQAVREALRGWYEAQDAGEGVVRPGGIWMVTARS